MAYTTIDDSEIYFKQITYTGTGNVQALEGLNHKPDFLWVKNRSVNNDFKITDSMRLSSGAPTITLESNTDIVEYDDADPASTTSFDTDGFTIGTNGNYNTDDSTYVGWSWKCNGGTTETTVNESGNNPGNSRQTNADAGFSIITYTGTGATGTIAHGLGAVPHWILFKARSEAENDWAVYHHRNTAAPATDFLRLNTNAATTDNANFMNDTAPTSSVFTVNDGSKVNSDGETYIAYCFSEKQGFSKFGSYIGNGNANGPYVHLGFKPAWVMVKKTTAAHSWYIQFNGETAGPSDGGASQARNPVKFSLTANDPQTQATENSMDFLSSGFKLRTTGNGHNTNDATYMYFAFAESPTVTSNGVPCNAA